MNYITLNNGVKMPQEGYGVYQVNPAECERCVLDAISSGYRLIDTAQAYHNEEGVGNAIKKCGVDRSELFIVTKIWISYLRVRIKSACRRISTSTTLNCLMKR